MIGNILVFILIFVLIWAGLVGLMLLLSFALKPLTYRHFLERWQTACMKLSSSEWRRVIEETVEVTDEVGKRGIPHFIALAYHNNVVLRRAAVLALGMVGDESVLGVLQQALSDTDPMVSQFAAEALGDIGDSSAVESLIATLKYGNPDVRASVARALGQIGNARALEPLIETLNDENLVVRCYAAEAIGGLKDSCGIAPLTDTLKDHNKRVQVAATAALYRLNYEKDKQMKRLIATLEDEDVAKYAAIALGHIKDIRSVGPLIDVLKVGDESVRNVTVIWALGRITGKKFNQDVEKWRKWWKRNKGKIEGGA